MRRNYLRSFCAVLCFILVWILAGCEYKGYSGEYVDLYTVAINSVLWNLGHSYSTDFTKDSEIEIIETDGFGRTLFSYHEKYYSGGELSYSALIVSQYSSNGQVYYYEDCNYIVKKQDPNASRLQDFNLEEIECLKSINDWDKPINADKCISKTISKNKQTISEVKNAVIDMVVTENDLSGKNYNAFADYLTADKNGNHIFYGAIIRLDGENDIYFVAFVSGDSEKIELLTPSDLYDYAEELTNFKERNGWVSK